VITPALKPFATTAAVEDEQPLASPDGTLRVFLVVTNQPSIGAFDCQRLMEQVNAFRATAAEGWEGGPLEILVTGRSAYVSEISLSMRHDIIVTVLGSIVLVGGVFFIGFHRWLPLIGMGITLLLCCLVSLAAGLLIFGELNMVTVGFCAILIGLGVDFAILIFGRYQQARDDGDEHGAAVAGGGEESRPRHLLRRAHDGSGISRAAAREFTGLYATRRADRDRYFPRGHLHGVGVLPVPAAERAAAA
jgi:predicted exporter